MTGSQHQKKGKRFGLASQIFLFLIGLSSLAAAAIALLLYATGREDNPAIAPNSGDRPVTRPQQVQPPASVTATSPEDAPLAVDPLNRSGSETPGSESFTAQSDSSADAMPQQSETTSPAIASEDTDLEVIDPLPSPIPAADLVPSPLEIDPLPEVSPAPPFSITNGNAFENAASGDRQEENTFGPSPNLADSPRPATATDNQALAAAMREYDIWNISFRKVAFQWQLVQEVILLALITITIGFGLYLSYLQLNKGTETQGSLKLGPAGIEVTSSILGVLILGFSFGFLYLYLNQVYGITVLGDDAASSAAEQSRSVENSP